MTKENDKKEDLIKKKDLIKKDAVYKDEPLKTKSQFRCKKCYKWFPTDGQRTLIVNQQNRPMEFEHVRFSSKAEVTICDKCYKRMERS